MMQLSQAPVHISLHSNVNPTLLSFPAGLDQSVQAWDGATNGKEKEQRQDFEDT